MRAESNWNYILKGSPFFDLNKSLLSKNWTKSCFISLELTGRNWIPNKRLGDYSCKQIKTTTNSDSIINLGTNFSTDSPDSDNGTPTQNAFVLHHTAYITRDALQQEL